jgi:hypothetical protein
VSRRVKTFTLSDDVLAPLEKRSKGTDVPMSRIVEQGIRMVLALPPEPKEEREDAPHDTGTKRDVKRLLDLGERKLRDHLTAVNSNRSHIPGWNSHFGTDIARAIGCSTNVAEKALKSLELDGVVYRWGDAAANSEGRPMGSVWGLRPALDVVRELLSGKDGLGFVRSVAQGLNAPTLIEARALARAAYGMTDAELEMMSYAEEAAFELAKSERERVEREETAARERREAHARSEAEWQATRGRVARGSARRER